MASDRSLMGKIMRRVACEDTDGDDVMTASKVCTNCQCVEGEAADDVCAKGHHGRATFSSTARQTCTTCSAAGNPMPAPATEVVEVLRRTLR